MRLTRSRAARRGLSLALAGTLLLAGCGDADEEDPTGGGSASSEPTGGSDEPSADPSDDPSEDSATGPEISTDSVTLNVPEGWETRKITSEQFAASPTTGPPISVIVRDFETSTGGETKPLDEVARDEIESGGEKTDPKILPETEIAGVPVFHLAGQVAPDLYLETFGPSLPDRVVAISFEFLAIVYDKRKQQIIDQVLASVEWTY